MKTQFTPGPWKASIGYYGTIFTVTGDNNVKVCEIVTKDADQFGCELEANALLIAAAPDMLEALQTVVAEIAERSKNTIFNIANSEEILYRVAKQCEAVIKRATQS